MEKMADKRRRRLSEDDSGEEYVDVDTDGYSKERPSECESEAEPTDVSLSEHESTTEDPRPFVETEEESETEEETEEEEEDEDTAGEEECVDEERQSGDGEEQPNKNLDDDEDKKNPAYIPRKGAFYEHDMRLDLEVEVEDPLRDDKRGKGKLWKDESRWTHDKFDTLQQAPKSREELIALYGYDITRDDKPPENPPRMNTRPRRGKARFGDYIDDDRNQQRKSYGSDRVPYHDNAEEDFPDLQQSRSYQSDYSQSGRDYQDRRRGRGGRGARGQRGGQRGGQRSGYSDNSDERSPRNKGFQERDRDNWDDRSRGHRDNREQQYANRRDQYEGRQDKGYRDRNEGFGGDRGYNNRARDNYDQRSSHTGRGSERDSTRNEGFSPRGYDNRNVKSEPDRYSGRDSYQTGKSDRSGYGERRNESKGGYSLEDYETAAERTEAYVRDTRNNIRSGRETRDSGKRGGYRGAKEEQSYGGDKSYHAANVPEYTDKPKSSFIGKQTAVGQSEPHSNHPAKDSRSSEAPETSLSRFKNSLSVPSAPKSYEKPSPKSYYTLSPVTDEEKQFMGDNDYEDTDFSLQSVQKGITDLNVTVTGSGSRRSFPKDKQQVQTKPRTPNFSANKGSSQAEDRGRRDDSQSQGQSQQSSKRYSSQRQRNPDGPAAQQIQYTPEPQVQHVVPSISQGVKVPVASPAMVMPRGPPPYMPVQVGPRPGSIPQHPPPGAPRAGPVASHPPRQVPVPPGHPPANQPTSPPPRSQPVPTGGSPLILVPPTHTSSGPVQLPVMTHPPLMTPMMFAAAPPPPPNFQMAVQPFPTPPPPLVATVANVTQAQPIPPPMISQEIPPNEQVRGGTTYYSQSQPPPPAPPKASASTITYYSPEMQVTKKKQQLRRPKAAIPIVNPQDIKKEDGDSDETKPTDVQTEPGLAGSRVDVEDMDNLEDNAGETYESYSPSADDPSTADSRNTSISANEIITEKHDSDSNFQESDYLEYDDDSLKGVSDIVAKENDVSEPLSEVMTGKEGVEVDARVVKQEQQGEEEEEAEFHETVEEMNEDTTESGIKLENTDEINATETKPGDD